jgi:hypothetical protein
VEAELAWTGAEGDTSTASTSSRAESPRTGGGGVETGAVPELSSDDESSISRRLRRSGVRKQPSTRSGKKTVANTNRDEVERESVRGVIPLLSPERSVPYAIVPDVTETRHGG